MKEASIQAYKHLIESGELSRQQVMVLAALHELGEATRQEISRHSGIPINCVCGRVNELLNRGLVAEEESRTCNVTGHTASQLRETQMPLPLEVRQPGLFETAA